MVGAKGRAKIPWEFLPEGPSDEVMGATVKEVLQ